MIEKKSWEEFRETGLFWFINTILHMFGWALVYEPENKIVYPARCKFRGFDERTNTEGYRKVSQYLKDNIDELLKEAHE